MKLKTHNLTTQPVLLGTPGPEIHGGLVANTKASTLVRLPVGGPGGSGVGGGTGKDQASLFPLFVLSVLSLGDLFSAQRLGITPLFFPQLSKSFPPLLPPALGLFVNCSYLAGYTHVSFLSHHLLFFFA